MFVLCPCRLQRAGVFSGDPPNKENKAKQSKQTNKQANKQTNTQTNRGCPFGSPLTPINTKKEGEYPHKPEEPPHYSTFYRNPCVWWVSGQIPVKAPVAIGVIFLVLVKHRWRFLVDLVGSSSRAIYFPTKKDTCACGWFYPP